MAKLEEKSSDWILIYNNCVWTHNRKKDIENIIKQSRSFQMYAIGDNGQNSYIFLHFVGPMSKKHLLLYNFKFDDKSPNAEKANDINDLINICGENSLYVSNYIMLNSLNIKILERQEAQKEMLNKKKQEDNIMAQKENVSSKNKEESVIMTDLWIKESPHLNIAKFLSLAEKAYFTIKLNKDWEGLKQQRITIFNLDESLEKVKKDNVNVRDLIMDMLSGFIFHYRDKNYVYNNTRTKIIFIVISQNPLDMYDSQEKPLKIRFKELDLTNQEHQRIFIEELKEIPKSS